MTTPNDKIDEEKLARDIKKILDTFEELKPEELAKIPQLAKLKEPEMKAVGDITIPGYPVHYPVKYPVQYPVKYPVRYPVRYPVVYKPTNPTAPK
jgi:hypothetical protein